jgi:hypothetical protein
MTKRNSIALCKMFAKVGEKVKYRVTTPFGSNREGDLVDAYLIVSCSQGLVYHPASNEAECPSVGVCRERNGAWEAIDDNSYVNFESLELKDCKRKHKKK